MNKLDEILAIVKENAGITEKKKEKKCNVIVCVLGVIAGIALIAGIVYAIYRFFAPSYLEDFDDDYEDDFDDDFFEDEEDEDEAAPQKEEEPEAAPEENA